MPGKWQSPCTSKDSGRSLNPLSTVVGVSNGAMLLARCLLLREGRTAKGRSGRPRSGAPCASVLRLIYGGTATAHGLHGVNN